MALISQVGADGVTVTVWDGNQTQGVLVNGTVTQVPIRIFQGSLETAQQETDNAQNALTACQAILTAVQSALTPAPQGQ